MFRLTQIEEETQAEMERQGTISRASCPGDELDSFASPSLLVSMANNSTMRLIIDYSGINRLLEKEPISIPNLETTLMHLQRSSIYSNIYIKNAFSSINVTQGRAKYTAFLTSVGKYVMYKLSMGMVNSPNALFKIMDRANHNKVVRNHKGEVILENRLPKLVQSRIQGVLIYYDDIMVYHKSELTHKQALDKHFKNLSSY
jgi:hypothetical protein